MSDGKKTVLILAPLSGIFYQRLSPDEEPFVKVGDQIERGMILCIVETMKVFNDVRSEVKGILRQILVVDEAPVTIHQPLMEIELN